MMKVFVSQRDEYMGNAADCHTDKKQVSGISIAQCFCAPQSKSLTSAIWMPS